MNKREKILAAVVMSIIVLGAGRFLFRQVFLGPLTKVEENIASVNKSIEDKKQKLEIKNLLIREWRSISRQGLSGDPGKAGLLLSERVTALISASGLQRVNKTPVTEDSRRGRGISYVSTTLSGRATLEQVVRFLDLFYREPYAVRITGTSVRKRGAT
jgi:hypothetical protein